MSTCREREKVIVKKKENIDGRSENVCIIKREREKDRDRDKEEKMRGKKI